MITLVTGAPGTGKSAYTLSIMLELLAQKRPLFVHGVQGLTIPHRLVKCSSPACMVCPSLPPDVQKRIRSADDWDKWAPKGAILWWDEVQHIHRPRSSGAKVPDNVAGYETHRHRGLDFFLTTQHPRLIDSNVRNLIGRHCHLVSSWKGRTMWEWPECSDGLSNKSDAVKNKYTLPKHVFPLYKSSQLHTKPFKKVPQVVYLFAAVVVVALVLVGRLYFRLDTMLSGDKPAPVDQSATSTALPLDQAARPPGQVVSVLNLSKFDVTPNEKTPYIAESAPAFVDLVKPVTFPKLSGCAFKRNDPDDCRCYTQQGTRYLVSGDMCRSFVKYGKFDPYRADGAGGGGAATRPGGMVRENTQSPTKAPA